MNIDKTKEFLALYPPKAGVMGRYSCSKIWSFLNGYCSPQQYLEGETVDFKGALRMFNGTMRHEAFPKLFPEYQSEVKKEMKVGKFIIVGVADYLNKEEVLEMKTSEKVYEKAKPWAIHQAKLYCNLFDRQIARIIQPIIKGNKLLFKELSVVKKDDSWFKAEMEKLKKFDEEVKKLSLEECVKGCESLEEFCEKCNGLLSKSDKIAQEVWGEYVASTK